MNILITGGAGFIGSHLVRRFLADGHKVICVDNFITSDQENIAPFLENKHFVLLMCDACDPISVHSDLDWVLHFASPASPVDYAHYPLHTLNVGTLGTYNALKLADKKGAKFMLASTSEVYGDPKVHPQPESYFGNVNTWGPRACYDEAKRAAEAYTYVFRTTRHIDTRVIRIFNTYGPQMRTNDGRVISNFIVAALSGKPLEVYGSGLQTRSFCYVDDLVEGILRAMDTPFDCPINLGNDGEFSILDLADLVISTTGGASRIIHGTLPKDDPTQRKPDLFRAKMILKWRPTTPLDAGLVRTILYFKSKLGKEA